MKNIVIVVDMQKGFARYERTQKLTQRIERLLDQEIFDAVIATQFLNSKNSIYEKCLGWRHLIEEEERQLAPGVARHVTILRKSMFTPASMLILSSGCAS